MSARTLYDKLWDEHVVRYGEDGTALLYIDRQLVHEVTSPQAFDGLRLASRKPWRAEANLAAVGEWVAQTQWADFLPEAPATRSCTSICLKIVDPWFVDQPEEARATIAKSVAKTLEEEGVAFDISSYRDAPAGLRIWGGATIEESDMRALLPWLDWAYERVREQSKAEAA